MSFFSKTTVEEILSVFTKTIARLEAHVESSQDTASDHAALVAEHQGWVDFHTEEARKALVAADKIRQLVA